MLKDKRNIKTIFDAKQIIEDSNNKKYNVFFRFN